MIGPEVYERALSINDELDLGILRLQVAASLLHEDRPVLARELKATIDELEDFEETLQERVETMEERMDREGISEVIAGP